MAELHIVGTYDIEDITAMTSEELEEKIGAYWDQVLEVMDSDIRESVHYDLAPCSMRDFIIEYLSRANEELYL